MAINSDFESVYRNAGMNFIKPEENNAGSTALGQEDFLALLTTQLANQDPFNPLENEDFVAQMAQFSSLEGVKELNDSFNELATSLSSNQALQASALVGRSVMLPSNVAYLDAANNVNGVAMVDSNAQSAVMQVIDASGQLVNQIELGDLDGPGEFQFSWNGTDREGNRLPPGNYQIQILGNVRGEAQVIPTGLEARVESVNLQRGGNQIVLNLAGLGSVPLSEVRQIGE